MILSNLVLELESVLDEEEVDKTIDYSINEVMNVFLDKKSGLVYEFVRLVAERGLSVLHLVLLLIVVGMSQSSPFFRRSLS